LLGEMLFKGDEISRQAALGLFWLIMAKDGASLDEGWITDLYTSALAQATENDRAGAQVLGRLAEKAPGIRSCSRCGE
jgi:hypothetical protein